MSQTSLYQQFVDLLQNSLFRANISDEELEELKSIYLKAPEAALIAAMKDIREREEVLKKNLSQKEQETEEIIQKLEEALLALKKKHLAELKAKEKNAAEEEQKVLLQLEQNFK